MLQVGVLSAVLLANAGLWIQAPAANVPLQEHPTLIRMLEENNQLRATVGQPPQRLSPELTRAAQDHAWYMARTGDFSHFSNGGPDGRAGRFGYGGPLAENIAMGQGSISEVFQGWHSSGGHWANIISDYALAGFGFAVDRGGRCFWVGMYGN